MKKIRQANEIVCPVVEKIKFFFWFWAGWSLAMVLSNSIIR